MIIWIASYPKSGNTWVRSFLGHYFFSKKDDFSFDNLKYIPNFNISNFIEDRKLIKNNLDMTKLWLPVQKHINEKIKKNLFFKTHNANININGNNFTDGSVSSGCIYVVRDPRNIITSYKNFENRSYESMMRFMLDDKSFLFSDETTFKKFGIKGIEVICSWSIHYNSWFCNKQKIPICLVKYEDLVSNPLKEFKKIFQFLKKINNEENTKFDEKRALHIINEISFENLKKKELKDGFVENNVRRDQKNIFFNQGKANQWEKLLPKNIRTKIEKAFEKEMLELDYLN